MNLDSVEGREAWEENVAPTVGAMGEVGERIKPAALTSGRYRDHLARYLFAAHFAGGRRVADLCCGIGYGSNLLFAAGATYVLGIDKAAEAITTAKRLYVGPQFEVGAADEPVDLQEFDVAICFEGIEHVRDPNQLLANMHGADVALVSSPNAEFFAGGFSGNPHHLREWTRDEFEAILARHFSEVRMYFQWPWVDPLDQDWNHRASLKALIPVPLKARLRPPRRRDRSSRETKTDSPDPMPSPVQDLREDYRVHPASYLFFPGLRYGTPATWVAVCRK